MIAPDERASPHLPPKEEKALLHELLVAARTVIGASSDVGNGPPPHAMTDTAGSMLSNSRGHSSGVNPQRCDER